MVTQDERLKEELAQAEKQSEQSLKVLTEHGFVIDTAQWLTIARYAKKYKLSQQVVVNWIGRGIVPADSTMIVEELNNIRLIRDQVYK